MSWRMVGVWVVVLAASSTAAADWKTFTSKEGRFKIKFPGTPTEKDVQEGGEQGHVNMHSVELFADAGSQIFKVLYYDLTPSQLEQTKPDELLRQRRDQVLRSHNGKTQRERAIKVNGHPGVEFTFVASFGGNHSHGCWRIIQVKERQYQLTILRQGKATPPATMRTFFDSFVLIK